MGDDLTKATEALKHKHNFSNLQEEYDYVNEVNQAIKTLEGSGGGSGDFDPTKYYDKTATDEKFITQTDGASAIADLVTNGQLASAVDTSTNFTAQDPTNTDAITALDTILANLYALYTPPARQATVSPEQMKELQDNILSELLKKIAK